MTRPVEWMSTRLFPKGAGAAAYRITGLAARCDWVLLSDYAQPQTCLRIRPGAPEQPQTVFVSARNLDAAITTFVRDIAPGLTRPFILFTGSEDRTLPFQQDKRWPRHAPGLRAALDEILTHPCLATWWVENLDADYHPKMQPMPLGLLPDDSVSRAPYGPSFPVLSERPLTCLCAHRVREGDQWAPRREVTRIAKEAWSDWTTILDEPVSEAAFTELLARHAFVLCVEGGGFDPSPKAWQAMLNGAIPIIRRTPAAQAYERLPVVFVDEWGTQAVTLEKLAEWRDAIRDRWQSGDDWISSWLNSLSLAAWWNEMIEPLGARASEMSMPLPFHRRVTS